MGLNFAALGKGHAGAEKGEKQTPPAGGAVGLPVQAILVAPGF